MKQSNLIEKALKPFKHVKLSILPTPIYRMDNLSRSSGKNLYCMRDDLTGFAFGGNKTRKLDFLIEDALSQSADCIVTFGSNQSNWCRMTSAAGAYNGMDVFMLFDGAEPDEPTGNLILDQLVGAQIEYLNCSDYFIVEQKAIEKAKKLALSGRKPYYVPVGGSTPIGTLGYIKAFQEILHYSEATGIQFTKIFVGTGSAGTQAGLVAGQLISGWEGEIIGISVGRERSDQEAMIESLVAKTLKLLNKEISIDLIKKRVFVDDQYYGAGYRVNTKEAGEAIELFAKSEGLFLDEVYTGKAAAGLFGYIEDNKVSDNENVLFIHTGGSVQLFE